MQLCPTYTPSYFIYDSLAMFLEEMKHVKVQNRLLGTFDQIQYVKMFK